MNRLRGVLKLGCIAKLWFFLRRERYFLRSPYELPKPSRHLRDGMTAKSTDADFLRRLDEGKTRDNFVGSHRNSRPQRFGEIPDQRLSDVVILEEGGAKSCTDHDRG